MKCKFYPTLFCVIMLLFCINYAANSQVRQQTILQIHKLATEKKTRTATERKISSQLLQAVREKSGKAMVSGITLAKANVQADAAGNLEVDIKAEVTDLLTTRIKTLGGTVLSSSKRYHSLRVKANLAIIEKIAGYREVISVRPASRAHLVGSGTGGTAPQKPRLTMAGTDNSLSHIAMKRRSFKQRAEIIKQQIEKYLLITGAGAGNSEGDHTMGVDSARKSYGYMGEGIKIGVLSDSYNSTGGADADIASGDLPGPGNPLGNTTPVTVVADITGGTDEGRAMLQIIHDLVPKAQLYFATAYNTDADFANNIIALRSAPNNCDIIIDDVAYFDEPVFQDGPIAQAVNEVTASGAMYFSSAGNSGSILNDYACVWEGDFNDNGSPDVSDSTKPGTIHNFGTVALPEAGDSIITASAYYNLQWADPIGGSTNDYDLFIVDSAGNVKASSTDIQDGTQDPYEAIYYPSAVAGDQLVVYKSTGAQIRAFSLNTNLNGQGKGLKYGTMGQTHGHSSAVNAFSVAATDASKAYPGLFTTSTKVEYFSSDGPRRIFYNADSTPVTPGNFLFATKGGTIRNKPDITAADGVTTTVDHFIPFYGTSAAAPHAGAIAALLKSAKPSLTPAQIRTILTNTALDIEAPGYDYNSGYGIIQAFNAMQAVNPKPIPVINIGKITALEGSLSNGNGTIDAGEQGKLVIKLTNPSLSKAYNVHGFLSTQTAGITILKDSINFGNIAAGKDTINTSSPFSFAINSSVPCGTTYTFNLSVSFDSGGVSPLLFQFSGIVGAQNISSTLGKTPPASTGYTSVLGQQTGRLSRGTTASSCSVPLTNPGLLYKTGQRQYDAYTFTNTSAADACINVTVTSANGSSIYTAAYDSAGFNPAKPDQHFLADPGQSDNTMQYSFTVAAGKKYTVVVHDINVLPTSGADYQLSIASSNCAAGLSCSPVNITTNKIATGATGTNYKQVFTATGGTNSGTYLFSITGGLPAGLYLNKDTLLGKPTQAGSFPIVLTAADPTGCSSGSQKDTIIITGDAPASVTAFAGTPQTASPEHLFKDTLKAKVFDAANKPLAGINVFFSAPATSPTGSFADGTDTATIVSDKNGIAAAPVFTAGNDTGTYTVKASVNGVATPAKFTLTNKCIETVVTSSADTGAGSLRYILENACKGATITFANGINAITLTSGDLTIMQGVTIKGPGAKNLTISGNNTSRIFKVDAGDDIVNISGLTITDGTPSDTSLNGGGGVLIYSGHINIQSCVITNNDASQTQYAEGGGIDNEGGIVTINNSSITNNTAYYDGGGIALEFGEMTISNSTIANNQIGSTSNGTVGGGIFCYQPLTITNCTIYGNSGQFGGNIIKYPGSNGVITIKNTIIAGGTLNGTGAGPDIWGDGFTSDGYNLIQDSSNGTITGATANDIFGKKPLLLSLGDYGGATPTLLPLPNSPVINKGDATLTAALTDQRGYTRVAAGRADIGAVEASYATTAVAGTPQSAVINTKFSSLLQGKVTENGNPVKGASVVFSAPANGASGSFAGGKKTVTATTNASGIATATDFTANDTVGSYTVTDSIGAAFVNAGFALTNTQTLAVTFGRISASANNCTVQVAWQTLTAQGGETFTVEYSTDAANFTPLYTTPGKGSSTALQTYSYTHLTPAEGANYYRIKQTDASGLTIRSAVITVVNNCTNTPVIAYPNPAHEKMSLILPGTAKQTVVVFDARGRQVAKYTSVTGKLDINVSRWTGGVYTVTVIREDKTVYTLKVVKQ